MNVCVCARERACLAGVWEPSVWKSALPSHPNSPFNLVHDHLEQRAHASEHAMSARVDRHTLGARVAAPRARSAVLFRRRRHCQRYCRRRPSKSLSSADYEKRVRSVESAAAETRSSVSLENTSEASTITGRGIATCSVPWRLDLETHTSHVGELEQRVGRSVGPTLGEVA